MNLPRIMMAAPASGSGKTLLTCALLGTLKKQGKSICSFKCGPDYIDPMFHRTVLGIPSENLDTWFSGEQGTRDLFWDIVQKHNADIAVMEGVMGLYDGLGGTREEGSAWHLAKVTRTPVILTVDVRGMGRSMLPLLYGFLHYDTEGLIRGILLNRISGSFYETMKPMLLKMLEQFSNRPYPPQLVGYFPNRKDLHLESRHLGLQLPEEIAGLKEQLEIAADQFAETVDLKKILEIAQTAEECPDPVPLNRENSQDGPLLAVARDEAFCFYYEANLRKLQEQGIRICYFSPLHDHHLPAEIDGILLGGGYPELWAKALSENASMRKDICDALTKKMPSLAECGGFMYLHRSITDPEGNLWPMAGVVQADVTYKGKLVRFGYVEVEEKDSCFLPEGCRIRGHEFHYYDSTDNGNSCIASKPTAKRSWECIYEGEDHFWGFPHLYYASAPEFAEHFADAMRRYHFRKL